MDKETNMLISADKCIIYKFTAPDTISTPGLHRTVIGAKEVPADYFVSQFNVLVRVEHQIDIFVPYPGKYLETNMLAPNSEANTIVPITVTSVSKGNKTIDAAWAEIKILSSNGKELAKLVSQTEYDIKTDEQRNFAVHWDSTGLPVGRYDATAKTHYDGFVSNSSATFKLGGLNVDIIGYSENVTFGGIKPFAVWVESIWSEPITDVKATVTVYKKDNHTTALESFETLTINLNPWDGGMLGGYIDTDKLGLGEYDIEINLVFAGGTNSQKGTIFIVEPPKPAKVKKDWLGSLTSTSVLLTALGLLLIIILAMVTYILLPKKKKDKQE